SATRSSSFSPSASAAGTRAQARSNASSVFMKPPWNIGLANILSSDAKPSLRVVELGSKLGVQLGVILHDQACAPFVTWQPNLASPRLKDDQKRPVRWIEGRECLARPVLRPSTCIQSLRTLWPWLGVQILDGLGMKY